MTLGDVTVVEIVGSATATTGRLLADAGAHVLLVEPHELDTVDGRRSFRLLVEDADVLIEGEKPGRLADLGLDYIDLTRRSPHTGQADSTPGPAPVNDSLIHTAITPFGRTGRGAMAEASRRQPMTDHTIKARAGWTDDTDVGPTELAGHLAFSAILLALLDRTLLHRAQPPGTFIDVSILAVANICAGPATVDWLAVRQNALACDDEPAGNTSRTG